MPQTSILVVEDDDAIRRGVRDALIFAGYGVGECTDGARALELALASRPDLVLLDILLPGMNGFDVLQELRRSHSRLPVIILTARGAEADRVRGLKLGADDYVVKPFSASELLARVEAVLRRSAERPGDLPDLRFPGCRVDLERLEIVAVDGARRSISELEAGILRYLAIHRGRPIARKELLQRFWPGNSTEMETRAVDMHIRRLREKLEVDPAHPRWILTVRGKGYLFSDDATGDVT